jgi:hypothetical protein
MESEYIALTHAIKETTWIRSLFLELKSLAPHPTKLHCDNQSAISLTKDSIFHSQTKHINIHYHFICETIDNGDASIIYCPTDDMIADILTKPLPRPKFQKFLTLLGLHAD